MCSLLEAPRRITSSKKEPLTYRYSPQKICPQMLRHTFCTLMPRNGVNLRDIQLLVGHSDISTTARFYLGCDEKQLKSAIDKHPFNI